MNPVLNPKKLVFAFLLSIIFLILFQNLQVVYSTNNQRSLDFDTQFEMTEYTTTNGFFTSTNNIDIELPSSSWKIDDIELNFTNLEFGIDVKTFEDNPIDSVVIDKFHDGYGVQIVIQDPTIIHGVLIYGNTESSENKPIYVQINGYNNNTHSPNNVVYGAPILLNMSYSLTPSWHIQTFSTPVYLTEGKYYLIMDGSSIGTSPKSDYYWYFNNEDPNYPELNFSEYDAGSWTAGIQGMPLLYKLIQKVNYSFFPEEINMTTELNGNSFKVSNGNHRGKGYLKKSDLNYHPNKKNITIEIKNNKTESLDFNLTYNFNINNEYLVPSLLKIKFNSSNEWLIFPEIIKLSNNYFVEFNYPSSWYNISITKNQQDITSDVVIDSLNMIILIPNQLIENGVEWEIKAYSLNVDFNLNVAKTDFVGGQVLQFSIAEPVLEGTYNYILINPQGIEQFQDAITLPSEDNLFSYEIPLNVIEGDYIAYIYWHNQTDAGAQSWIFYLSPPLSSNKPQDFPILFILGIVLIGGSVIGGSGYVTLKKVQSNRNEKLRLILEKCSDVMNLEYIIVLDEKSGIDVYSEAFAEKDIEPTLISGFLQAIQNFGSEVLGRAKDSRTFKVEYRKSIVFMTEFVNLRLIVIMKENPSKNFLYTIDSLAYDIYKDYGHLFEKFKGILGDFQGIKKLLEQHLNISFIYPLKVAYSIKMKLSQAEREMIKRASNFMRENNLSNFHSINLLPENACTPKDYETILQLIEKRIFRPIDTP